MIRTAKLEDIEDILEIYNDAIENTTAIYSYKPHTLTERQSWYKSKIEDGYPILVFEKNCRVVAFATFGQFRTYPAFKYTMEHSVYVHKDYRGNGIATDLMKELIKLATQQEYATLVGVIDSENESSIKIHEKLGFTFSGRINKAGYKFGKWLDLVFLQLDLPGPQNPREE